jgi:hypothetical protein
MSLRTCTHLVAAVALAALLTTTFATTTAHAGRACNNKSLTVQTITKGMALAQRTSDALDAEHARSGAHVVVLGRSGQDLSAYRLRYSHLGWAYKTPEGPWRVLHKLNECGANTGSLYRQGLGEFFLDDLWRFEAVWSVPVPALQAPLLALLTDPVRSTRLNTRAYSLVSYPWSTRYQQSNQWALETLASAAEPGIASREQAQAWLKFKAYQPSVLRIGAMTRLGARAGSANVAFDDHPSEKRFADRIETVTVDSVLDWLARSGLATPAQSLAL